MKANRSGLTHVLLAASAFTVVLLATRSPVGEAIEHPQDTAPKVMRSVGTPNPPAGRKHSPARSKARGFQDAWERIASRRLSRKARIELQIELLARWGEVDLEGALEAVLAEAWDENLDGLLKSAFGRIFADRPDEVWRMIQSQRFGILGTALVRSAWVKALSEKNPDLILSYLPEMKGVLFRNTINSLADRLQSREQASHLWMELVKKGGWSEEAHADFGSVGRRFADLLSTEELRGMVTESKAPLARLACSALATKLARQDGTSDIRAEIDKVPENLRSQLAFEFLLPANRNKSAVFGAFEHLIENEEWVLLGKRPALEQVRWLGTVSDPLALADWAANLPPRNGTAHMFDQGMGPFIKQDPKAAWEWASRFEEGMWKDRVRGHFAVNSLKGGDSARSQEYLNEILDPAIRTEVGRWLSSWNALQVGKAK